MRFVKKISYLGACLLLIGCAQSLSVSNMNTFASNKSGVIGVFRQPVGFCSGGYQQQIILGGEKIIVKPTWTSAQDNLFSAYIEPGQAEFVSYHYACGMTSTTLTPNFSKGIIIPENGFCKITMSFLKGDSLFSKNDSLLQAHFIKQGVAIPFNDIPYCETY